tara:strand:+ start:2214 stop:2420 length:207 start_codon:yes stop_codon:yes gene_type:complete
MAKNWIPSDLKKGRCTPAPNPDCPKGSPQYNLAMTFKKHAGERPWKKKRGGQVGSFCACEAVGPNKIL